MPKKHFSFRPIPIILIKSLTVCNCQRRGICRGNRNKYPQVNNLNGESMFCPQGSSVLKELLCVHSWVTRWSRRLTALCIPGVFGEQRLLDVGMAHGSSGVLYVDTFLSICLAKLYPRKCLMSDITLIWNEWRKHLGAENFRNRERWYGWF